MAGVVLAACRPSIDVAETASGQRQGATIGATSVDLRGSWRLATLDGRALDPASNHDILMLASSRSLRASSQCIQFWRNYSWTEQGLRVVDHSPVLMCSRGLTDTEIAFGQALSGVDHAERTGDGLVLTGRDHRLVFTAGSPPDVVDVKGTWRLHSLDGQMPGQNQAILLTFDGTTLNAASNCMRAAWTYEQIGSVLELSPADAESCERTRTPWETRVFESLGQTTTAVSMPSEHLVLGSAVGQIELDRLP